jgi:hypothetical protein
MINGHKVYYREGMTPNENKGTAWIEVGDEGNLVWLDVGENLVYAIDDQDQVFRRTGINEDALAGGEWDRIPGLMMQLSLY